MRPLRRAKAPYLLEWEAVWPYHNNHYDGDDCSCSLDGGSPSVPVDVSRFTGSIFTVRNSCYEHQVCSGSLNHLVAHSTVPPRVDRSGLGNLSKIHRHRRPYPGQFRLCRGAV